MSQQEHKIVAKTQIDDELAKGLEAIKAAFSQVQAEAAQTSAAIQVSGKEAEAQAKHVHEAANRLMEFRAKAAEAAAELKGALLPGVGGVALGIVGLTSTLAESIKMASEEEVGLKRLSLALKDNMPGWDGNTEAIERVIEARKKLGFDDELQRDSLAQMVRHTHDASEALRDEAIAMDFARGRQISLEEAGRALGKALDGNVAGLRRYGVQIKEGATATEAMAQVQAQFAGQSEAYSHTAAGSLDRLKIAIDDAFKKAGTALLPIVADLATKFANALPGVVRLAEVIGSLLAPALQLVGALLSPLAIVMDKFSEGAAAMEDGAQRAGEAVRTDFAGGIQAGMSDAAVFAQRGASSVSDALDIADDLGESGEEAGASWAGGPSGVTGGIDAGQPNVIGAAGRTADNLRQSDKFRASGSASGQDFLSGLVATITSGLPAALGAHFATPGDYGKDRGILVQPGPIGYIPGVTPGQPPPWWGQTPSKLGETSPEQGVDVERQRRIQQLQQAAIAEGQAHLDAADKAKKHGEALAKQADAAAKAAKEAQQQVEVMTDEARVASVVAQAEQHLADVQAEHKRVVDELTAAEEREKAANAELESGLLAKANAAQAELAGYTEKAEEKTRELNQELRDEQQALRDIEARASTALNPLIEKANQAATAVRQIQEATRKQDEEYDRQAHDVALKLQPLQDQLEAQNEALEQAQEHVTEVSEAWDTKMAPAIARVKATSEELTEAQRALNDVQNEDKQADRAKRLHDEQQQLGNLAIRIASATGAQKEQLEIERKALQERMAREGRRDQAEDRISALRSRQESEQDAVSKLQEQKDAAVKSAQQEVKTAEDQIKATNAKIKSVQDEQKALERLRAEYDYQQKQAEIIAQKKADDAAADLKRAQDIIQSAKDKAQAEIDSTQSSIDAHNNEATEEERILKEKADRLKREYDTQKSYDDSYIALLDGDIKKADEAGTAEEERAKKVVTAAKDMETQLSTAYQTLDKFNQQIERGAKATPEMTKAMGDAKTVIGEFRTQGVLPLRDQLDPEVAKSLAAYWAKAWSSTDPHSFPNLHNAAIQSMGNKLTTWAGDAVHQWDTVTAAVDRYTTAVTNAPGAPGTSGQALLPHMASGGSVVAGRPYFVGEHGPELFMPYQSGQIYPTGSVPYRGGYGSAGAGPTIVNISPVINFSGGPMMRKEDISYTVRDAILKALREHGKQLGTLE